MLLKPPSIFEDMVSQDSEIHNSQSKDKVLKNKHKKKQNSLKTFTHPPEQYQRPRENDNESVNSNASRQSKSKKTKESSLGRPKVSNEVPSSKQDEDVRSVNSNGSKNSHKSSKKESSLARPKNYNVGHKKQQEHEQKIEQATPKINYKSFKTAIGEPEESVIKIYEKQESPQMVRYGKQVKEPSNKNYGHIKNPRYSPFAEIENHFQQDESPVYRLDQKSAEKYKNPGVLGINKNEREKKIQKQFIQSKTPEQLSYQESKRQFEESRMNETKSRRRRDIFGNSKDGENSSRVTESLQQSSQRGGEESSRRKSKSRLKQIFDQSKQKRVDVSILGNQSQMSSANRPGQSRKFTNTKLGVGMDNRFAPIAQKVLADDNDNFGEESSKSGLDLSQSNHRLTQENRQKDSLIFQFEPQKKKGLSLASNKSKESTPNLPNIDQNLTSIKNDGKVSPADSLYKINDNLVSKQMDGVKQILKQNQDYFVNSGIMQLSVSNSNQVKKYPQNNLTNVFRIDQQEDIYPIKNKKITQNGQKSWHELVSNQGEEKLVIKSVERNQKVLGNKDNRRQNDRKRQEQKRQKQRKQVQIQIKEQQNRSRKERKDWQDRERKERQDRQREKQRKEIERREKEEQEKIERELAKKRQREKERILAKDREQIREQQKKIKQIQIQNQRQNQVLRKQKQKQKQILRKQQIERNAKKNTLEIQSKNSQNSSQKSQKSQSKKSKCKKESTMKIVKPHIQNRVSAPWTQQSFYQQSKNLDSQQEQKQKKPQKVIRKEEKKPKLLSFTDDQNQQSEKPKSKTDINFYDYSNSQKSMKPPSSKPPLSRKSNCSSSSKSKPKAKENTININMNKKSKNSQFKITETQQPKKMTLMEKAQLKHNDKSEGSNSQDSFRSREDFSSQNSHSSNASKGSRKSLKKQNTININLKSKKSLGSKLTLPPSQNKKSSNSSHEEELQIKQFDRQKSRQAQMQKQKIMDDRVIVSKQCTFIDEKGRLVTKDLVIRGKEVYGKPILQDTESQVLERMRRSREGRRSRSKSRENKRPSGGITRKNSRDKSESDSNYEESSQYSQSHYGENSNFSYHGRNQSGYNRGSIYTGGYNGSDNQALREFIKPVEEVPVYKNSQNRKEKGKFDGSMRDGGKVTLNDMFLGQGRNNQLQNGLDKSRSKKSLHRTERSFCKK